MKDEYIAHSEFPNTEREGTYKGYILTQKYKN